MNKLGVGSVCSRQHTKAEREEQTTDSFKVCAAINEFSRMCDCVCHAERGWQMKILKSANQRSQVSAMLLVYTLSSMMKNKQTFNLLDAVLMQPSTSVASVTAKISRNLTLCGCTLLSIITAPLVVLYLYLLNSCRGCPKMSFSEMVSRLKEF